MIQFDYEHQSYFGSHVKVIIEDGALRYREFVIDYGKNNDWVSPKVDKTKIQAFLESLESLNGCSEDYRNDSVLDGMSYTIITNTDSSKKTIHGYHDFQSTVAVVLSALKKMDKELDDLLPEF